MVCLSSLLNTWTALFLMAAHLSAGLGSSAVHFLGPQAVNLWKLEKLHSDSTPLLTEEPAPSKFAEFLPQWFEQPLDHFDSSNNHTFKQRYWFSTRHYRPGTGGPVIVLDGGETSGENRLPFLDTGIVEILTRATGGVGVILEHRYYGESITVENLTTDSLRWLNNEQAAADSANFMSNIRFPGIEEDLTAPGTPWIYYGGSYAGARAAHMRVLYPELVYGAIASSGVTHAEINNWRYMDIIRQAADPKCVAHIENAITTIDAILTSPPGRPFKKPLKALFGLSQLGADEDFVSVLESPLSGWQAKCWNEECGSDAFDNFCEALGSSEDSALEAFEVNDRRRLLPLAEEPSLLLDISIFNYAKYIRENVVSRCPSDVTVEECFGTYDDSKYQVTTLDQTWRLWIFQVCTQWGYFMSAPPQPDTPRIISRLIDLNYESKICAQAFPRGKQFQVPPLPNITVVNELGDFDIAADRLAIIDGEVDPWRPDTPHALEANEREDTILRPFKLIPGGVHHYDEYGLRNLEDEPEEIRKIHGEMILFVMEWLKDWGFDDHEGDDGRQDAQRDLIISAFDAITYRVRILVDYLLSYVYTCFSAV